MPKQLTKLKEVALVKSSKQIADNGEQIEAITEIGKYYVSTKEVYDDVSLSIYGANINNISRLSSVRFELESYLKPKLNNKEDNLSKYYIKNDDKLFRIRLVKNNHIDVEMFEN